MNRSFYSTIIKALLLLALVHFLIKRVNAQARLTLASQPSIRPSVTPTVHPVTASKYAPIEMDYDSDDISDISREDLKRSLQDFVEEDVVSRNISDMSGAASGMPADREYADYRPLSMQDTPILPESEVRLKAPESKSLKSSDISAEAVCNGGQLMDGVCGYDSTMDNYSMVMASPPSYPVKPVIA